MIKRGEPVSCALGPVVAEGRASPSCRRADNEAILGSPVILDLESSVADLISRYEGAQDAAVVSEMERSPRIVPISPPDRVDLHANQVQPNRVAGFAHLHHHPDEAGDDAARIGNGHCVKVGKGIDPWLLASTGCREQQRCEQATDRSHTLHPAPLRLWASSRGSPTLLRRRAPPVP